MRYILTGGSGFIGTHFSQKLKENIQLNIDIEEPDFHNNYLNIDILDRKALMDIQINNNNDYCLIHLAAVHFDFQKGYFETNVDGTKNILEFVKKNKIKRFVFFSSVAVYGNSENGKDENSDKIPINNYGKSKWEAEKLIRSWHNDNEDCKVIIVRPAVVYGEFNFGNVFNLIMQIKSKFYAVIGDGDNIKSIAYAKNLVDSVLFSLENYDSNYFEYNYCDYPQQSTLKLSNIISNNLNFNSPYKIPLFFTKIISFPIDLLESIFNVDLKFNSMRIKKFTDSTYFISDRIRDLGFKPKYSFENSIERTLNWIEKNDVKRLRSKWYNKAKKL